MTPAELELWAAVLAQALAAEIATVIDRFKDPREAQAMSSVALSTSLRGEPVHNNRLDNDGSRNNAPFVDADDVLVSDGDGLGGPILPATEQPASGAPLGASAFSVILPEYATAEAREHLSTLLSSCMLCIAFKEDAYCPQLKLTREQVACSSPPQCHPALNPCPRPTDICKPQLPERLRGTAVDYIHHVCVPAEKVPGNDAYWAPAPAAEDPDAPPPPYSGGSGSTSGWPETSGNAGGGSGLGMAPTIDPNTQFQHNMGNVGGGGGGPKTMTTAAKVALAVMCLGVLVLCIVYGVRRRKAETASFDGRGGGLRKSKSKGTKIDFGSHVQNQSKLDTRVYTGGGDYAWDELSAPVDHSYAAGGAAPVVNTALHTTAEASLLSTAPPPVPSSLLKPRTSKEKEAKRVLRDLPLHLQHAGGTGVPLEGGALGSIVGDGTMYTHARGGGVSAGAGPSGFESAQAKARTDAVKARQMSSSVMNRAVRAGTRLESHESRLHSPFARRFSLVDSDGSGSIVSGRSIVGGRSIVSGRSGDGRGGGAPQRRRRPQSWNEKQDCRKMLLLVRR